ncbi:cytochrome c oxidase subunit 3-like [Ylistrum balloti]|uniref:cytochrome c oxidase subunit 3-like n=1 Tax=Ylistrum balloti TaxID=509963 RepID=UPI002905B97B|nr:cytochrome c oxidase subunit 3-like [Ylistrum balloti]
MFAQFLHGDPIWRVLVGLCLLVRSVYWWFVDIVTEATFLGKHTRRVQRGVRIGFCIFLVRETMFFASFFWAFFHSALAPGMALGFFWPPQIYTMSCWGLPLLNTSLLLRTVCPCNLAQAALKAAELKTALITLGIVMILGACFVVCQGYEIYTAKFTIADGIYGSCFFSLTGLHGLHVIGGLVFLFVAWNRARLGHFSSARHLNLTFAVWYWHFVDVIWIFVYRAAYLWRNLGWQWTFDDAFNKVNWALGYLMG